jgi:hypothetical protein
LVEHLGASLAEDLPGGIKIINFVKGCEINLPDLASFNHGCVSFIAVTDKDGCVTIDYTSLGLHDIRRIFSTVVRKRKKEKPNLPLSKLSSLANYDKPRKRMMSIVSETSDNFTDLGDNLTDLGDILSKTENIADRKYIRRVSLVPQPNKKALVVKSLFKGVSKMESLPLAQQDEIKTSSDTTERGLFYRDVAIFRYRDQKAQILSDSDFLNIFLKRTNDPYWKKIDYVQTNIKAKIGLGKPIFIDFYADFDDTNPLVEQ